MRQFRRPTLSARYSLWLRATWVVLELAAAAWMARSGLDFYYQGF